MVTIIGHKSTLLFLLAVSYCSWRISKYGKSRFTIIAYRAISIFSLLMILLYFFRNSIPGIDGISIIIFALGMLFIYGALPFPGFQVEIPKEKKRPVLIEIISIFVLVLIIMGVWQRVSP
jgi:hypothetical protein